MAANMTVRSMYNWLLSRSSMIILTKCIHCGSPVGIRPLYLIQPKKQSLIWVAPIHDCLRYLILNFQYIVVHFKHIHFCLHKHQWPLPISTCYDVTHPVESQYHQHWSFFVVPSISVSLKNSTEILFATNSKIHYWCAGSFSISFSNTDLVYQTHQVEA